MSGCAILFPLVVTLYLTWWCLEFFDNFFRYCPATGLWPPWPAAALCRQATPSATRPMPTDRWPLPASLQPRLRVPIWVPGLWAGVHHHHGLHLLHRCVCRLGGGLACPRHSSGSTYRRGIDIGPCPPAGAAAGVFTSSWIGTSFVGLGEYIIRKVPLVKHIYGAAKQISAAVSPDEATNSFRECVLVRHPRHGEYAFGFITGQTLLQSPTEGDLELFCVYSELGCLAARLLLLLPRRPPASAGCTGGGERRAGGLVQRCVCCGLASPACALNPSPDYPMRSPYEPRLRGGHLLDGRKGHHPEQPLGQGGHRCAAAAEAAAGFNCLWQAWRVGCSRARCSGIQCWSPSYLCVGSVC